MRPLVSVYYKNRVRPQSGKALSVSFHKLSTEPDLLQREVLRRYNVSLVGAFGDGRGIEMMMENPEHRNLFNNLVAATVEIEMARHSIQKLLKIAELLLVHKANPTHHTNIQSLGERLSC